MYVVCSSAEREREKGTCVVEKEVVDNFIGRSTHTITESKMKGLIAFVFIAFVLAGLTASVHAGDTSSGSVVIPPSSTVPPIPFDWLEFLRSIGAYIAPTIAGLIELYKRLKDRNWKNKYEKVVVTRV
jgi:hypothetical protein